MKTPSPTQILLPFAAWVLGACETTYIYVRAVDTDVPVGLDVQSDTTYVANVSRFARDAWTSDLIDVPSNVDRIPSPMCQRGEGRACVCVNGLNGYQGCLAGSSTSNTYSQCRCYEPLPSPPSLPPRLLRPFSGLRATSRRPSFHWVMPAGMTQARIDLCDDRACSRRLGGATVTGDSWQPTELLRPGVIFWRVQALRADGSAAWTSATWEVGIRHRDTPVDNAWGKLKDFNGDGYDDVVVQLTFDRGRDILCVFPGAASGVLQTPSCIPYQQWITGHNPVSLGDVNGDGLTDMVVATRATPMITFDLYLGSRTGPILDAERVVRPPPTSDIQGYIVIEDYNGDGFGDIGVFFGGTAITRDRLSVFPGQPDGFGAEQRGSGANVALDAVTIGLGDVDQDGYGDSTWVGYNDTRYAASNFGGPGAASTYRWTERQNLFAWSTFQGYAADMNGDGRAEVLLGTDAQLYRGVDGRWFGVGYWFPWGTTCGGG
jgi:hypothetical protein